MITYNVKSYENGDRTVDVVYTNTDTGLLYKRTINIPYNLDGSINEEYFQDVLEGQLRNVENKFKIGLIKFEDDNSIGIGTTTSTTAPST